MQLRFIDFFAGIGGISLGLERAGHRCVGQVEIAPFCQRVLAKHWPDVPRWSDIRELTGRELPEADLWAGGFPCQDISNAGKRAGIRGERSGLFFDFMRLVRMVRPRLVVLENVDAIAENGLRVALGELAEIGFDAEWEIIPACAMGAPHTRRRMFVVAYPHIGERASGGASGRMGRRMVQTAHANQVDRERNAWPREPSVGRVADGVPNRVDRLRALGNAVVPQVAEYIGRLLSESTDMKEQS